MVYFGVDLSIEAVNNVWVIKKVVEEEILKNFCFSETRSSHVAQANLKLY